MKLHFFNPGYEASISLGSKHYTPTKQVQAFRHDLSTLPLYFKNKGDKVYVPKDISNLYSHPDIVTAVSKGAELAPWGWAPELFGIFGDDMVAYTMDEMRQISSRRLSLELWRLIVEQTPEIFASFTPPSLFTPKSDADFSSLEGRQWVLKEEFSSSGRGVQFIQSVKMLQALYNKRKGKKNSSLFIEPFYEKIEDRGYEFYRDSEGNIHYVGPSCFETLSGNYVGNIVRPSRELDEKLQSVTTIPTHFEYISILISALSHLDLGRYEGFLGIDTLVTKDQKNNLRIVPCLEINCRPTMGHLALSLGENWLPDGFEAYFTIRHLTSRQLSSPLISSHPLYTFSEPPHDIGWYPLTPVLENSKFVALMKISKR